MIPNFMKFLRACFFILGLLIPSITLFAEEIQVSSNFDKRTAQVGEDIHLTVRISGADGSIQAPRLPGFNGFDTFYTGRASRITFINGQSSSNIEFSYTLIPKSPGRHNLSPIEVFINGQRFATQPVEIDVTGTSGQTQPNYTGQNAPFNPNMPATQSSAGGPVAQEPPPAFMPEDDNIFIRAWVDKNVVYPNEQVLLTYSLYTRYDTRYEGFEKEAQMSGFWIEDFPMEKDIRRETVHVNGKRYIKADIKQMALFPTASADYTIDPGILKASIRQEAQSSSVFDEFFNDSFFSGGGFFARRESRLLKPAPIQVTVKPFPEKGKPASFQGAVGNFKMTASLDKETVKQNEPVTLKMVIEGEGNIETLNKPPTPEMEDLKIYDSDSSSQLFKTGNVIGGRKTFEMVIIPTKPGNIKMPRLEFSYFNPASGNYVTQKTPAYELAVTPSAQTLQLPQSLAENADLKKQVEVQGKDIRFIWETIPSQSDRHQKVPVTFDWGKILGISNALLGLLVFLGLMRRREERAYAKDRFLKRRKFAKILAEKGIRRLQGLRKKTDSNYFEEAEKVLTHYLTDKFDLSAHGITRHDLEIELRGVIGVEDPLLENIRHFYHVCDESRFGRGEVPIELKDKALEILKATIAKVEKRKR